MIDNRKYKYIVHYKGEAHVATPSAISKNGDYELCWCAEEARVICLQGEADWILLISDIEEKMVINT